MYQIFKTSVQIRATSIALPSIPFTIFGKFGTRLRTTYTIITQTSATVGVHLIEIRLAECQAPQRQSIEFEGNIKE